MPETEAQKAARELAEALAAADTVIELTARFDAAMKAKDEWEKTHNPDGTAK
jgi:hypothetical protein